jgi:uncharacterized protein YukE
VPQYLQVADTVHQLGRQQLGDRSALAGRWSGDAYDAFTDRMRPVEAQHDKLAEAISQLKGLLESGAKACNDGADMIIDIVTSLIMVALGTIAVNVALSMITLGTCLAAGVAAVLAEAATAAARVARVIEKVALVLTKLAEVFVKLQQMLRRIAEFLKEIKAVLKDAELMAKTLEWLGQGRREGQLRDSEDHRVDGHLGRQRRHRQHSRLRRRPLPRRPGIR